MYKILRYILIISIFFSFGYSVNAMTLDSVRSAISRNVSINLENNRELKNQTNSKGETNLQNFLSTRNEQKEIETPKIAKTFWSKINLGINESVKKTISVLEKSGTQSLALATYSITDFFANGVKSANEGLRKMATGIYRTTSNLFNQVNKVFVQKVNKDKIPQNDNNLTTTNPVNNNVVVQKKESLKPLLLSQKTPESTKTITIVKPIRERIIEKTIEKIVSGVSQADLQKLSNKLYSKLYQVANTASAQNINAYRIISLSNKIDNLSSITISGATISGSTFSGSTLSLTGALTGTAGTFSNNLSLGGKLVVTGSATSTFSNGINLSDGCFAINGVCIAGSGGGGSGTVSSGTTGYLPYYASTGTTLTATSSLFLATSQNVGIGTTSPYAKLSVAGFINTDQYSGFKQAGNTILYASSTISSTYIGNGTGSMSSIGIGNSFAGEMAGKSNTAGNYNSFMGFNAGYKNTTGSLNSFFGSSAGYSNTIGNYNSFIGVNAGYYNISGSNNTANGYIAGAYITDGIIANATGSNSTFFGNRTKAFADGDTNETVIGYDATGIGSNSVVIGNDSVLTTILKGDIGIGTTSPWRTLSVNGSSDLGTNALAGTFTATSTTATSTFAGGLNVASGGLVYDRSTKYVGVGTGSPTYPLDVRIPGSGTVAWFQGSNSSNIRLYQDNNGSTVGGYYGSTALNFSIVGGPYSASKVQIGPTGEIDLVSSGTNQNITLTPSGSGYTLLKGNVGIGTTSPYAKLSVTGFINTDQYSGFKQAGNTIFYASTTNGALLVGQGAGNSMLSDGFYNTALGYQALYTTTSADSNTVVGYQAGLSDTTGSSNSFVGTQAGNLNTTGSNNSFIGMQAGYLNTTGSSNSFIGASTGVFNTTGSNNTAIGYQALYTATSTDSNTAVGYQAGFSNTTGYSNSFVGTQAGYLNTIGYGNSFLGAASGQNNTIGYGNSFVGANAGISNTTGYQNSFLGEYAGGGNSTGYNNVFLGYNTSTLANGGQNETVIGYNAVGAGSNSVVLGNDSVAKTILKGNIGIGTTSPYVELSVVGKAVITGTVTIEGNPASLPSSLQIGYGGLCVDNDGTCVASTTGRISAVEYTTGSTDLAEMYYSSTTLNKGEIVSTTGGNKITKASQTNKNIIGIVSTAPGIILGLDNNYSKPDQYPVALSGRVPVKVNLEGGVIKAGDSIALSSTTPGVGMKASSGDLIIGTALQNFNQQQEGSILVFVGIEHPQAPVKADLSGVLEKVKTYITNLLKNGVGEISATVAHFKDVVVKTLTADKVVTNGIEMKSPDGKKVYCVKVNNDGKFVSRLGSCSSTNDQQPADNSITIKINNPDNNPAYTPLHSTYSDSGVTIKKSGSSYDFYSLKILINDEATTTPINILTLDTSTTSIKYKITYVATDNKEPKSIATTTRIVIIEAKDLENSKAKDVTKPILPTVSISSNNASTTLATTENTVTLNFTASEEVDTPIVTIAGHAIDNIATTSKNVWTATYIMQAGDQEGIIPFTIDYKDIAGNDGDQVTGTTDSTSVTFDKTVPTITLKKDNPQTIEAGADYLELGVTVTDNHDTGLIAVIDASAVASTTSAGTYKVTYNVTDNAGNKANEVIRTIKIIESTAPATIN